MPAAYCEGQTEEIKFLDDLVRARRETGSSDKTCPVGVGEPAVDNVFMQLEGS